MHTRTKLASGPALHRSSSLHEAVDAVPVRPASDTHPSRINLIEHVDISYPKVLDGNVPVPVRRVASTLRCIQKLGRQSLPQLTISVVKSSGHTARSTPFPLVPTLYLNSTASSLNRARGLTLRMSTPTASDRYCSKNEGLNIISSSCSWSSFNTAGTVRRVLS